MLFSLFAGSVASIVTVDSIVAGATLGTTIFCCARNKKQPTTGKRK